MIKRHRRTAFLAIVATLTFVWAAIYQFDVDPAVLDLIPVDIARKHKAMPLMLCDQHLVVAVPDRSEKWWWRWQLPPPPATTAAAGAAVRPWLGSAPPGMGRRVGRRGWRCWQQRICCCSLQQPLSFCSLLRLIRTVLQRSLGGKMSVCLAEKGDFGDIVQR